MTEEVYNIYQDNDTRALIRFHICGTTFPDKTYQISRGEAKTYCIEYIEEGKGTVHLNDETFYPCAGDSYFLHAGKEHNYYSNMGLPFEINTKEKREQTEIYSLECFQDVLNYLSIIISEITSKTFWWHPPQPVEQCVTFCTSSNAFSTSEKFVCLWSASAMSL